MYRTILLSTSAVLALFVLILLGNAQTNPTAEAGVVYDIEFAAIDVDPTGNTAQHIGPDAVGLATNGINPGDIQSVIDNVPLATPTTIDIVIDEVGIYDPTNSEDSPQCAGAVNDDPGDDALINDGCPAVGAAETGANCANATDDAPVDGFVNDGCPVAGAISEANLQVAGTCSDGVDNAGGGDTAVDNFDPDCYDSFGPSGGIGLFGTGFNLIYDGTVIKITENNTAATANNNFLQFSVGAAAPLVNNSDIDNNPGEDTDGNFRLDSVGTGVQEAGPGRVAQIVFECTQQGHSHLGLQEDNAASTTAGLFFANSGGGTYIIGTEFEADVYCDMAAPGEGDTFVVNKNFEPDNPGTVTVSLSCAPDGGTVTSSDNTAGDAPDTATFTVTGATGDPTCTATETDVPAGYTTNSCSALLTAGGCTIVNTQTSDTFDVVKDYQPDNGGTVTVSVTCSPSGTAVATDASATDGGDDANFTVTGFTGDPTCTAAETGVAAGYVSSTCSALLSVGTCTIVNTQNSDTFDVIKDYQPDNGGTVTVSVTCSPSGTAVVTDASATDGGDDANFTVTGFTGDPTCTATETGVAAGYVSSTCSALLSVGTCTIVNVQTTDTFVVGKDFQPDDPAIVTITLSCSPDGAVTSTDNTAGDGANDATFTVTGFSADPTCTATETGVPAGYSTSQCSALLSVGTCEIVNVQTTQGTIIVQKTTDPAGDPQEFTINLTGPVTDTGTITDADDETFTDLPAGTYSLSEVVPAGWMAGATSCSDGSDITAIDLSTGETVTCTFNNTKLGTIIIGKTTNPAADPTSFPLNLVGPTGGSSAITDATDAMFLNQAPGAYTATETTPAPWLMTSVSCGSTASTAGANSVSFTLDAGATVTCTFANETNDTFVVEKDFQPDTAGFVTVTLTCAPNGGGVASSDNTAGDDADDATFEVYGFSGDPACTATETGGPGGYTTNECSAPLSVGTCTIINTQTTDTFVVVKDFEPDDPGTVTVSLSCAPDGGTVTSTDNTAGDPPDDATFTVTGFSGDPTCTATETGVPAGYTTSQCQALLSVGTCTILNTPEAQVGTIIVQKTTDPAGDPQEFTINLSGPTSDTGTITDADDETFADLPAGIYSLSEVIPAGWMLGATSCSDESPIGAVDLSTGETVTCTINNIKLGTIIIEKTTNPAGDLTSFPLNLVGPTGGSSSITDATDAMFTNQAPGAYTATETLPAPWSMVSVSCTGATGTPGSDSVSFTLAAGATVTCTFVNETSDTFVVEKDFQPDAAGAVTVTLTCAPNGGTVTSGDNTAGDDADDATFTVSGFSGDPICTATETGGPAGYTSNTCSAPLSAGTCTIINVQTTDTFIVVKDFQPDNPGTVTITLACAPDGGTVTSTDNTAGDPPDDATFTVTGFSGDPTCTATETGVPAGYITSSCSALLSVGTCTIVNTQEPQVGTIIVQKTTDPAGDPQEFTFNLTGPVSDTGTATDATDLTFDDLPAGTYSLSEVLPAGWMAGAVGCSDESSPTEIGLSAGETVTCTFNNTKLGTIVIGKTTNPAGDPTNFPLNLVGPTGGSSSISHATDAMFTNQAPGAYTATETLAAPWAMVSVSCTGATGTPGANSVAFTLAAGGSVTCTFINETRATFNVNKDFVPNDSASVTVGLACSPNGGTATATDNSASEADDANFTVTGFSGNPNCTATESPIPPGYTSSPCSAPLSTGVCTIVNTVATATFVVHKDFVPNNPGTVTVSLSCAPTGGTVTSSDNIAGESGNDATFTVTGYSGNPNCTANESGVPVGYVTSTCTAPLSAGQCTIVNQAMPSPVTPPPGTQPPVITPTPGVTPMLPPQCAGMTFDRTFTGTNAADTIIGTQGRDLIYGLGGNDYISGQNGDDCLVGGEGNDTLNGDAGNDVLVGGNGADHHGGGYGDDRAYGNGGDDTFTMGAGNDVASGGDGNDTIAGNDGNDTLCGDGGNDYISGGNQDDRINGGLGNDTLNGNDGNDTIDGGGGVDAINGGTGTNTIGTGLGITCP